MVTGTSLMETDCNLFIRVAKFKELTSVVRVQPHQLACIIVTLQQLNPISRLEREFMWDCMHMEEVCNKVILILFCSPPSQETCQYLVVLH